MKILCVADAKDNLVYSSHAKDFFPDVDFVIGAGDLSLFYYEFIISALNKPLYFVFGNHNLEHYNLYYNKRNPHNIYNQNFLGGKNRTPYPGNILEDKVYRDKKTGLLIAGLGGSKRYNNGKHQFTDAQMRRRIWKMAPKLILNKILYGRYLDILVTHAAPLGINDDIDNCHKGFASFLTFMEIFKPKYLLHGHIHLTDSNAKREAVYKRTKIINVYQSFVLEDKNLGDKDKNKG